MRALACIGLDSRNKGWGGAPWYGPFAPAYRLQDLPPQEHAALEQVYAWSNGGLPHSRGITHAGDAPLYDGPSLSMGDVILLAGEDGDWSWWRVAMVGFDRLEEPAPVINPLGWRPPRATPTRPLAGGDSFTAWLPLIDRLRQLRNS